MLPDPPKTKKQVLSALLELGATQVVLDPRREGVRVPPAQAGEPMLRLNFSYRFVDSDLKVDWWGVRQTLTFSDGPFNCQVPWEAIFAAADPRRPESTVIWAESMPEPYRSLVELRGEPASAPTRPAASAAERLARRPRRGAAAERTPGPEEPPEPAAKAPGITRGFTPRLIQGQKGQAVDPAADKEGTSAPAAPQTSETPEFPLPPKHPKSRKIPKSPQSSKQPQGPPTPAPPGAPADEPPPPPEEPTPPPGPRPRPSFLKVIK